MQETWGKIRQHIDQDAGEKWRVIRGSGLRKSLSVAAVFLVLAVAGYFYFKPIGKSKIVPANNQADLATNDIKPGGNKALLTLGNGDVIALDSTQNGTLTTQGNTKLVKQYNGQLAYDNEAGAQTNVLYNTISTPRGGQYQVILADGSKVWLNALSSIRFPTAFAGKERRVEITGEAYFEVAHNASMPFIVMANGVETRVLGTHFNINAYNDETDVETTLLEGAVQVSKGAYTGILKPGQQSHIDPQGNGHIHNNIDVNEVVAWKDGFFRFKEAGVETIMRQIARWYNVDVIFEGPKPTALYTGRVSRNINLGSLLKVLELSDVNLDVKGNKIVVKK